MDNINQRTKVDPALWTTVPVFGAAGGPLEVVLTDEGNARAFSVGAQVRRGAASAALLFLHASGGSGVLAFGSGARLSPSPLGHFDQVAWGHLRALGYVESVPPVHGVCGDGVRLTDAGRRAVAAGLEERARLLDRSRRAHEATR